MLPSTQQHTLLIPADDQNQAQYANPMNDPFAEVEIGWRKMNNNEQVLDQLNQFSFTKPKPNHLHSNSNSIHSSTTTTTTSSCSKTRKLSLNGKPELNMNLSMRRSDQIGLFRPPSSASASKTSFSSNELSSSSYAQPPPSSRTRLSSFSTDLEPISASPTSPNSPYSFPNYDQHQQPTHHFTNNYNPPPSSRRSLPHPSWIPSSSSSLSSDEERLILRRASSSSIGSISSSSNSLKARRGLTKPLSLAVPNHHSNSAQALATPLRSNLDPKLNSNSAFSRSLPPSPRMDDYGQARAQFVGMKANFTGGFSMKRRTSIPRLTLGASVDGANENTSSRARSSDPVRLIGRNYENSAMNTPVQLHFDPVAAGEGRRELMSSQAGIGGKGHIEVPSELTESFPYEYGPKEVLPDVYLGSEQNARDGNLLSSMGFGLIINVAKEVECPWEAATSPAPIENTGWKKSPNHWTQAQCGLMVRPTASTPNLKRSFEGKIRVSLPNPANLETRNQSIEMKHLDADSKTSRPSLDYIKLPWSHDQDGLASIFNDTEVFNLIDKARERRLKTLVHCQCGVSRSATFVIGYCMREAVLFPNRLNNLSGRMHDAYSFVKEKSPWAGPNMGLIYQLIEYEKVLFKKRGILEEDDDEMEEDKEDDEEEETSREDIVIEEDKKEGEDEENNSSNLSEDQELTIREEEDLDDDSNCITNDRHVDFFSSNVNNNPLIVRIDHHDSHSDDRIVLD